MVEPREKPTCFIAMPITTQPEDVERYGGDEDHWGHVMGSLFETAIEQAGFQPIRPAAQGAHLIHGLIIRHLSTADLVLVDLSTHNPNVFFELGVRTSLNLPIALVRDEHTKIPFDTSGINTHRYDSNLRGWEVQQQQQALAQHIKDSHVSCDGQNPLWRQFGLTIRASEPDANESPLEAKMDLLMGQMSHMRQVMRMQGPPEPDREVLLEFGEYWDELPNLTIIHMSDAHGLGGIDLLASMVKEFLMKHYGLVPMLKRLDATGAADILVAAFVDSSDVRHIYELAEGYGASVSIRHRSHVDRGGLKHRLSEPLGEDGPAGGGHDASDRRGG